MSTIGTGRDVSRGRRGCFSPGANRPPPFCALLNQPDRTRSSATFSVGWRHFFRAALRSTECVKDEKTTPYILARLAQNVQSALTGASALYYKTSQAHEKRT